MQKGGEGESWRKSGLCCRVDYPPVVLLCGLFISIGRYLIFLLFHSSIAPMSVSNEPAKCCCFISGSLFQAMVIHLSNLHILNL